MKKQIPYHQRLLIYEARKSQIKAKDHKDYERQIQKLCKELKI